MSAVAYSLPYRVRTGGPKLKKWVEDYWSNFLEILHAACPPDGVERWITERAAN